MVCNETQGAFEVCYERRMSRVQDERNNKGRFSAENFVRNLMKNGQQAVCDETSQAFRRYDLPEYYKEELYKRGQQFFYKHIFGIFLGKFLGLISILSQKSSLAILMMTNRSSSDFTAFRRYIATMFHILIWYENDFRPNSKLWTSLKAVKLLHNSASKRASSNLFYRISQKDMAITQFGFLGFVLTRGEMIGIHNPSQEELKGFIHLWRVVGYILGIEEQLAIYPKKRSVNGDEIRENSLKKQATETKKVAVKRKVVDTDQSYKLKIPKPPKIIISSEENSVPCLICGDIFGNSKPGEAWIQCNICSQGYHKLCADYSSKGFYICDCCK